MNQGGGGGIHQLPPEVIIEAVFNPHPATEEGPFTFVPMQSGGLEKEEQVLQRVILDGRGAEEAEGGKGDVDGGGGKDEGRGKRGLAWLRGRRAGKVA